MLFVLPVLLSVCGLASRCHGPTQHDYLALLINVPGKYSGLYVDCSPGLTVGMWLVPRCYGPTKHDYFI